MYVDLMLWSDVHFLSGEGLWSLGMPAKSMSTPSHTSQACDTWSIYRWRVQCWCNVCLVNSFSMSPLSLCGLFLNTLLFLFLSHSFNRFRQFSISLWFMALDNSEQGLVSNGFGTCDSTGNPKASIRIMYSSGNVQATIQTGHQSNTNEETLSGLTVSKSMLRRVHFVVCK